MMSRRLSTDRSYDADLYHRALTGRGAPVTGDEVRALLHTLEEWMDDYERVEKERDEARNALADAWIVPQEEPFRPCEQCVPSQERGDGRCERHGRLFSHPEPCPVVILHRFRKPPFTVVLETGTDD